MNKKEIKMLETMTEQQRNDWLVKQNAYHSANEIRESSGYLVEQITTEKIVNDYEIGYIVIEHIERNLKWVKAYIDYLHDGHRFGDAVLTEELTGLAEQVIQARKDGRNNDVLYLYNQMMQTGEKFEISDSIEQSIMREKTINDIEYMTNVIRENSGMKDFFTPIIETVQTGNKTVFSGRILLKFTVSDHQFFLGYSVPSIAMQDKTPYRKDNVKYAFPICDYEYGRLEDMQGRPCHE